MADDNLLLSAGLGASSFLRGFANTVVPARLRRAEKRQDFQDLLEQERLKREAGFGKRKLPSGLAGKLKLTEEESYYPEDVSTALGIYKADTSRPTVAAPKQIITPEQFDALQKAGVPVTTDKYEVKGDFTAKAKTETKEEAKTRVNGILGDLSILYSDLDKSGGIVNKKRNIFRNLGVSVAASTPGQYLQKKAGTEVQSIRNKILAKRPLLVNAIRQATGMSARAMDSDKELQFYLQAATDPQVDVDVSYDAIKSLDELYGLGILSGAPGGVGNGGARGGGNGTGGMTDAQKETIKRLTGGR